MPRNKGSFIVLKHALRVAQGLAMATWLLISPAAVLVARLARNWSRWYSAHSLIHTFVTLPATVTVFGLGFAAKSSGGGGSSSASLRGHAVSNADSSPSTPKLTIFSSRISTKVLGFVLLGAVSMQAGLGLAAHKLPLSPAHGSTRPGARVVHILLGVTVLVLSWIQISLGLNVYQRRPRAQVITILFAM